MPHRMPRRAQELLNEFIERAHELVRVQGHMNGLMTAIVSMAEDLSLQSVLEQLAQSAAELLDSRYAAIGVVGPDDTLTHFITVGIDEDQKRLMGDVPTGHGVLGQLIREPKPLRLHDLHEHPLSVGFPENHPPMKTFLGVPIRVREAVFGNLYLTEKAGGEDYTAEDEELAAALAAAAGVAIQNARLYEDSRRRQRWLEAGMEASTSLIVEDFPSPDADLDLVAEHALRASDAVLAVVAAPTGEAMEVHTAVGALAVVAGQEVLCPPSLREADAERRPLVLRDPEEVFGPGSGEKLGQVLAIPIGHGTSGDRLLLLARQAGSSQFTQADLESGAAFGSHVGLALDLNIAHRQREEALISVDRDRIAQDLHDLVIQRLFAAGLGIQNLRRFATDPAAEARITKLTEELDESIRELRNTIYSLRAKQTDREGLSRSLFDAVHECLRTTGITPKITVEGRLEDLPSPLARQVLAVVTETVSNAARHSGATSITVALTALTDAVEVLVEDDGKGFAGPARASGLANIQRRARSLDGTSSIDSVPGAGTRVLWRVPLTAG